MSGVAPLPACHATEHSRVELRFARNAAALRSRIERGSEQRAASDLRANGKP
jgi:hypothetical protein